MCNNIFTGPLGLDIDPCMCPCRLLVGEALRAVCVTGSIAEDYNKLRVLADVLSGFEQTEVTDKEIDEYFGKYYVYCISVA